MTAVSDKMLSIVVLSYHSAERLPNTCAEIEKRFEKEKIPIEIIIVDDGSTDNSFEVALNLANNNPKIRAFQLNKNSTSPYAQFAGFKMSKGACAFPVPDDLQRPLDLVVDCYRAWEKGAKIAIGYRTKRDDGFISDFFSNLYYRLMNRYSNVNFPPGGADGFLADREVLDILNNDIKHINTSPIIEILKLGFDPVYIPYERPSAKSKSRWTWKKKMRLATDTFFTSSVFPLKMITWIGFTTFIISLVIILAIVLAKLFSNNTLFGFPVQGWATLMIIVTMFNGLVLFCLGIVAEYIWRIHDEVKGKPGYFIRKSDSKD